jgi:hypothetical protein
MVGNSSQRAVTDAFMVVHEFTTHLVSVRAEQGKT